MYNTLAQNSFNSGVKENAYSEIGALTPEEISSIVEALMGKIENLIISRAQQGTKPLGHKNPSLRLLGGNVNAAKGDLFLAKGAMTEEERNIVTEAGALIDELVESGYLTSEDEETGAVNKALKTGVKKPQIAQKVKSLSQKISALPSQAIIKRGAIPVMSAIFGKIDFASTPSYNLADNNNLAGAAIDLENVHKFMNYTPSHSALSVQESQIVRTTGSIPIITVKRGPGDYDELYFPSLKLKFDLNMHNGAALAEVVFSLAYTTKNIVTGITHNHDTGAVKIVLRNDSKGQSTESASGLFEVIGHYFEKVNGMADATVISPIIISNLKIITLKLISSPVGLAVSVLGDHNITAARALQSKQLLTLVK